MTVTTPDKIGGVAVAENSGCIAGFLLARPTNPRLQKGYLPQRLRAKSSTEAVLYSCLPSCCEAGSFAVDYMRKGMQGGGWLVLSKW